PRAKLRRPWLPVAIEFRLELGVAPEEAGERPRVHVHHGEGRLSSPLERLRDDLSWVAPLRGKEPELEVVHHDWLPCLQVRLEAIAEPRERGFPGEQEPCKPGGLPLVAGGVVPG